MLYLISHQKKKRETLKEKKIRTEAAAIKKEKCGINLNKII